MATIATSPPSRSTDSVGIVERYHEHFDFPLRLSSGKQIETFTIAYECYGELNTDRNNVILICHALSGDAHVAGYYSDDPDENPGWWDEAVGPGKMFDTDQFFVICSNVIGGCRGSTGPSSIAPDGQPYAMRFPIITVQDMVHAQKHLMDRLGIRELLAVAGGSMGGMQALSWAVEYPDMVRSCIFLASTMRSSAQQIAFNETGRQAIYADPNWDGGNYYTDDHPKPHNGLSVARMVAHITYMSETSMEQKFGRSWQDDGKNEPSFDTPDFSVESYLRYQGNKFVNRFDANSYLYITKAIDLYDVAERYVSASQALDRTRCPFLVCSFTSDWLYTIGQALDIVKTLLGLRRRVEHHHINSHFGHDSFLVEVELMTHIVGDFIKRQWATLNRER